MTSSPGATAASMAAIIASVAPQETVTSASGSSSKPQAADCFFATALRSCGAPHVVAYWLKPSRSALAAASRMRSSVLKSGNPWAKFTALSAPLSCRFSRVISRMTDSVKLCAFSESRIGSVSWISPLQLEVGARARVAAHGPLQAALPPAADLARPSRLGEEVEHVRAAQQADHLAAFDHRHPPYALADQQSRGLVDPRLLGDGHDTLAHDVARHLAFLREHVGLRDDADHVPFAGHDGRARDSLGDQSRRDLFDWRVLTERDHVARHHFLDRDHQWLSSVATVSRLALPPLKTSPVRPCGSLPER